MCCLHGFNPFILLSKDFKKKHTTQINPHFFPLSITVCYKQQGSSLSQGTELRRRFPWVLKALFLAHLEWFETADCWGDKVHDGLSSPHQERCLIAHLLRRGSEEQGGREINTPHCSEWAAVSASPGTETYQRTRLCCPQSSLARAGTCSQFHKMSYGKVIKAPLLKASQ